MTRAAAIAVDCQLTQGRFRLAAAFDSSAGVTALFGPSGSGKSTLIDVIAGLRQPDHGRVVIGDSVLLDTERGIRVPAHKRRIGMVFQDAQLLPHLSVRRNLLYGQAYTPPAERRVTLGAVTEALGIGHLLERAPATLSGGERQRVGIGRALLVSPRLLLMDEPLASLDANRKLEILPFIEHLRDAFGIPIVYVSHAVEEVARLASRVVRLAEGRVVAVGTPAETLSPTALGRGADRFNAVSMITGRVAREDPSYGVTVLAHPAGEIVLPWRIADAAQPVRVAIRATNVTLAVQRPSNVSVRSALHGSVVRVETDDGPFALVTIELVGGDLLFAYATRLAIDELGLDAGDHVHALVKTVAIDERGVTGLNVHEGST